MKKIMFLLPLAFFLASCGDEEEQFEDIDFKVTGIELRRAGNNAMSYYGELPAEGGTVTFEAQGKNQVHGYLSYFNHDTYFWMRAYGEQSPAASDTLCEGNWGLIEELPVAPPTTRLTVTPNTTGAERQFNLSFGGGYKVSDITIKQPSK